MNVASAAGFLSYEFETEILLSENASVFSHGLGVSKGPNPDLAGPTKREATGNLRLIQRAV
jgi:hypothetical protein